MWKLTKMAHRNISVPFPIVLWLELEFMVFNCPYITFVIIRYHKQCRHKLLLLKLLRWLQTIKDTSIFKLGAYIQSLFALPIDIQQNGLGLGRWYSFVLFWVRYVVKAKLNVPLVDLLYVFFTLVGLGAVSVLK